MELVVLKISETSTIWWWHACYYENAVEFLLILSTNTILKFSSISENRKKYFDTATSLCPYLNGLIAMLTFI